jgi:hypothetical protein
MEAAKMVRLADMPPPAAEKPHIRRIEAAHPAWHAYWAFGQPWAHRRDNENVAVRGEDWDDLTDEIKRSDESRADELEELAAQRVEENRQL